ncbi:helix-turn-helix domain-containing protein [Streptomyces sp. NPDC047841]|uniref:ATP-binding protein n=1 Tax=Streptomyces sp. NPDC047841 TaxID=3154708 RepID=UPI0034553BEB
MEPVRAAAEPAFGSVLRELRLAASLTIEGLAEASGVSVRGISDLERGHRTAPQRRTLAALARGLGLSGPGLRRFLGAARAGRSDAYTPVGVQAVPQGVPGFVGRERELSRFAELAALAARGRAGNGEGSASAAGTAPVVVAVSGPPGVGKTTLALQAARRLAGRFPDGQLVVDMRGLDDEAPTPVQLMLGVLRALRVTDRELGTAGPEGYIPLYRQTMAQRRFVLVLDNARDEAQVRPLLPAAGEGVVIVTSRRMLTGLEGVHRVPLDVLSAAEATALLARLGGDEYAAAGAGELERIALLCGRLPLALRLAGHWLATRRTGPVARPADPLVPAAERWGRMVAGDVRVSGAFDLSYRQLSDAAGRMFRRLALVPGPDVSAAGAARLCGQPLFDAEDALEELVEAGLLGVERDRYRMHDLLRIHAGNKLGEEEDAAAVARAGEALHDWLLRTAIVAGRWYEPGYGAPPAGWEGDVDLSTADKGRAWLQEESANWLAALRAAAASGRHATVVEVAESLHWFSDQWVFWGHWPEVFAVSADSAERTGDPVLHATHLNYLAWARLVCEGRHRDGLALSTRALDVARLAGDRPQQAWAHFYRAWAHRKLSAYGTAAGHMSRASRLFDSVGDLEGGLSARHGVALILTEAGHAKEAFDAFRRALEYIDAARDRLEPHAVVFARIGIHGGMADCCERLGRPKEAVFHLRTAVGLSAESGNTGLQSRDLHRLGVMLLETGRTADARAVFARVIALGPSADPRVVREAAARLEALDAVTL